MLASTNRFHGYGALRYVYKNGTAKHGALMIVKSVTNERRRSPRIAIVVSKKVLKSAVGRNRIRRRLYELLRHELPDFHQGRDIVCIVTSAEVRLIDPKRLRQELQGLLRESDLYR